MTQLMRQTAGVWHRLTGRAEPWLFGCTAAALAALLSGTTLWGVPAPFAPALCAAVPGAELLFAAAGGVCGSLLSLPLEEGTRQAVACLAALAARLVCGRQKKTPVLLPALAAAFGLLGTELFWQLRGGGSFARSLTAVACAGATVALAWLGGRLADALSTGGVRSAAAGTAGWAVLCWGAATVAALCRFSPGSVSLGPVLAGCVACCLAAAGQKQRAFGWALAAGLALAAADAGLLPAALALAGGTLAAGAVPVGMRSRTAAAFLAGTAPGLALCKTPAAALLLLAAFLLGGAAFLALPGAWLGKAGLFCETPDPVTRCAGRLTELGDTLTGLNETVEKVCDALPRAAARPLEQALCEGVCLHCSHNCDCWVAHGGDMQDAVNQLGGRMAGAGLLTGQELPGAMGTLCARPQALCAAVNNYLQERLVARCATARTEALRSAVTEQLTAISQALYDSAKQLDKPPQPPLCWVETAVAGSAAADVSADVVRIFSGPDGKTHMVLSDGAGVGAGAAVDGALAATLAQNLLAAGFAPADAARMVNTSLAVTGKEGCATLDILSLDPVRRSCRVYKAGGAPTYFVRDGKVGALSDQTLPVGVLGAVHGGETTLSMAPGDLAVLVSDGMLAGGDRWLQQLLAAADGKSARQIAAALLDGAATRGTTRPDDRTAAVIRILR